MADGGDRAGCLRAHANNALRVRVAPERVSVDRAAGAHERVVVTGRDDSQRMSAAKTGPGPLPPVGARGPACRGHRDCHGRSVRPSALQGNLDLMVLDARIRHGDESLAAGQTRCAYRALLLDSRDPAVRHPLLAESAPRPVRSVPLQADRRWMSTCRNDPSRTAPIPPKAAGVRQ